MPSMEGSSIGGMYTGWWWQRSSDMLSFVTHTHTHTQTHTDGSGFAAQCLRLNLGIYGIPAEPPQPYVHDRLS